MRVSFASRSMLMVLVLVTLVACQRSRSDFLPRGGPDSLLDISSEVVNLSVAQPTDRTELANWIRKDLPTRAELYCNESDPGCTAALKLLDKRDIPTMVVPSANNTVTLVYERILAHDCSPRYRDPEDFMNKNHPAFGCAIAANTVQHVSNKQDFVNPRLSDTPSAEGAVSAYRRAMTPRTDTAAKYSTGGSSIQSVSGGE